MLESITVEAAKGRDSATSISIIVPTLNEEENIDPLFTAIFSEAKQGGLDVEIVVVDDRSTDGTRERVRKWERDHSVKLLERDGANGLAGAVLAGAAVASRDIVVVMDADLSHPPERVAALVGPIVAGSADMVIGSRYTAGGHTPGWPWTRRLASRLAAILAWPLTEVRDSLAGFFAVRRGRLLEIPADAAGFKIGLEVLVRGGESLRVREVPITFRDRTRGQSKMKLGVILAYVARLFAFGGVPVRKIERADFLTATGVMADLAVFFGLLFAGVGLSAAHIAGFAAASVVNFFLRIRPALEQSGRGSDRRLWMHQIVVLLTALSLRGGVLALLTARAGWPPELAILPAIAAAAMVTLPGRVFCFSSAARQSGAGMRWRMIAIAVVGCIFILRLAYLGLPELMPEEAYYWNYSRHPDIGYLDHPPMVAWLAWLGTAVSGRNEFGVRIGAFGCWVAASLFVFGFARNLFNKSVGFVSVLFMQVLPFYFSAGLLMTPDAPLTACWAGALYAMERAFIGNRSRAWWIVGACMGLGMISKYSIGLVAASAAVFILLDAPSRRWLLRWEPYAGTLLALLIFSPVIIWNMQTDWASFAFQTTRRLAEKTRFSLHALIGSAAVMLSPTGLAAAYLALRSCGGELRGGGDPARRRALFILVFTLVPLSVFIAFSLRHQVKLEWTGPMWMAVLPAVAAGLIATSGSLRSRLARGVHRAWEPTILILVVFYGAGLHYLALGLPGVGYSSKMHLIPVGWRDLARQVDAIVAKVKRETGKPPLVTGLDRYFTSSEFAFYSADPQAALGTAAGVHLFGPIGLMYERWFPAFLQEGRNIILVGWNSAELASPVFQQRATRLGPIERGVISRDGKWIRDFHHRVLYGYRGGDGK